MILVVTECDHQSMESQAEAATLARSCRGQVRQGLRVRRQEGHDRVPLTRVLPHGLGPH